MGRNRKNLKFSFVNLVYQTMFLIDSTRPCFDFISFKTLRLTSASSWMRIKFAKKIIYPFYKKLISCFMMFSDISCCIIMKFYFVYYSSIHDSISFLKSSHFTNLVLGLCASSIALLRAAMFSGTSNHGSLLGDGLVLAALFAVKEKIPSFVLIEISSVAASFRYLVILLLNSVTVRTNMINIF